MVDDAEQRKKTVLADTKRRPRTQSVSREVRYWRLFFRFLGRLMPSYTSRIALKIWEKTRRYGTPPREQTWLVGSRQSRFQFQQHQIHLNHWGQDAHPVVLLVHGWGGRGSQMAALAPSLVDAGYQVVACDLPGHGESSGASTSAVECAALLKALSGQLGPFHAVVAHSFGVVASTLALRQGLPTQRFVGVGAPAYGERMLALFSRWLQLPEPVHEAFLVRLEERYGAEYVSWLSSVENVAELSHVAALIVHDEQDKDVSWESGQAVASAWPGASFLLTHRLGHRRILRDDHVKHAISAFVCGVSH